MATRQQLVMATVSLTVVGWLGTVEVHGEDGAATFVLSGVSFHFCKILSSPTSLTCTLARVAEITKCDVSTVMYVLHV